MKYNLCTVFLRNFMQSNNNASCYMVRGMIKAIKDMTEASNTTGLLQDR